jgi:hypothetical protein
MLTFAAMAQARTRVAAIRNARTGEVKRRSVVRDTKASGGLPAQG